MLGTISLVGGGLPLGLGGGLAAKVKGTDQVTVVFFGDDAANQGTFHECLNMASLWRLPEIFICENNLYAMSVAVGVSTSVQDIGARASAYDMPGVVIYGNDAVAVYETVQSAVARARKGEGGEGEARRSSSAKPIVTRATTPPIMSDTAAPRKRRPG